MSGWRDQILAALTPDASRLTVVLDPDGLLTEEHLVGAISAKGIDVISFQDPVSFRYAYESKYRSRWDLGQALESSVVVRFDTGDSRKVPYDLLEAGRLLSFSVADIFPNLNCQVVSALDRSYLDSLFSAQQQHCPDRLGENSTKDFILRHIFGIAPELIYTSSDLLRVLLRRHHTAQRIPKVLDDRFIQVLRQRGMFGDWPLDEIVPHNELFYAFIQERWLIFVGKKLYQTGPGQIQECLALPGPVDLPFSHDDVRVYIDDLFSEGYLRPLQVDDPSVISTLTTQDSWIAVGIQVQGERDTPARQQELIEAAGRSLPKEGCSYQDWLLFAHRWARVTARFYGGETSGDSSLSDLFVSVRDRVDSAFSDWMLHSYAGLHNQPPLPPVMVHHVPRFLARQMEEDPKTRIALVVVDGMAFDQWVTIRDVLIDQEHSLLLSENAVFAWVPTVTSVSRQAMLAGKPPLYFPTTIGTTDAEQRLWRQFWGDYGLSTSEIAYIKGVGESRDICRLSEVAAMPRTRVLAIIVDKLDKIIHGMELGTGGMQNQVLQWAKQGFLHDLIRTLMDSGFRVFLASDHGNMECVGIGRPSEGTIADVRGERVRVYRNAELRSQVRSQYPDTLEWPTIGLPDDYLPLLANGRYGFISTGETLVSHGGISIDEVVVPLVEVKRRTQ